MFSQGPGAIRSTLPCMRRALQAFMLVWLTGCWDDRTRPRTPEECKVTTDPEACRKAYQR